MGSAQRKRAKPSTATAGPPGTRSWTNAQQTTPELCEYDGGLVAAFSAPRPGRDVNQDAALLLPLPNASMLLAVADGMGGARGGARAAALAVDELRDALGRGSAGRGHRDLVLDGLERANARIQRMRLGAGATLIAALVEQRTLRLFHAGDSQALLVGQRGAVKALTGSHSPVGYAVAAGMVDHDEALHHPALHLVSNALGNPELYVEHTVPLPLAARDTLLLASDGLFDNIYVGEIVDLIRSGPLMGCARALVGLAKERMGSPDDEDFPSKADDLTLLLYRPRP